MANNNSNSWTVPLLVALITAITTITGSFLAFKSDETKQDTSQLEVFIASQIQVNKDLLNEIRELKIENNELQVRLFKTQIEMVDLRAQLKDTVNHSEVLQGYLEAMPIPAWIKIQREDGQFEMVFINEHYTSAYGTTKKEYIGATDFDIHPHDLALAYRASDLAVVESGRDVRVDEFVELDDGQRYPIIVIKFTLIMPDGTLGIGGMVVRQSETAQ